MKIKRLIFIVLFILLSVGCSSLKTYPDNLAKNVFVKSKTDSGSAVSSVKTRMDIHDVDKNCELQFLGTVRLDEKYKSVGLKVNKLGYLDFVFFTSGFFSNSSSATRFSTLFKPRKGYFYDISVTYIDDIYGVEILEKRSRRSKGREVETRPLHECRRL